MDANDEANDSGAPVPGGSAALAAIEGMFKAFALGDVDAFVGHLTEDVVFEPPSFLLGKKHYRGHQEVRAGFAELDQVLGAENRVRAMPKQYCIDRADPDKLLVLAGMTITRRDGEEFGAEATLLLTMRGDKVAQYQSWPDFDEGRRHLQDPVEVGS